MLPVTVCWQHLLMLKLNPENRSSRKMAMKLTEKVSGYLSKAPSDKRKALESLRKTIRAAAPKAVEEFSYGVPMFKHLGHPLVSYGFSKAHCSFYVQSPAVMKAHAKELAGYDISKGTVRFSTDKPLPAALVKKLVKARIKETEQRFG
jgi:uncharacterized protein YdhG (YjbR/CyaY superfamily)